jgi:large subunit ribosomal protein L15
VNLESLNVFEDGAKVDFDALRSVGLANGKGAGIKILGTGDVTKKLSVSAHAFSASAKAKIEAKGGTCEVISAKKAEPAKA